MLMVAITTPVSPLMPVRITHLLNTVPPAWPTGVTIVLQATGTARRKNVWVSILCPPPPFISRLALYLSMLNLSAEGPGISC